MYKIFSLKTSILIEKLLIQQVCNFPNYINLTITEMGEQSKLAKFEKRFPARADLNFGKSQKSHDAKSGDYGECSIKRIPLSSRNVRLCDASFVRSCIVVM